MRRGLLGTAFAIFACFGQQAAACDRPEGAPDLEMAVLAWANAERDVLGLPPLRADGNLRKAALGHACDMAQRSYFAHARDGGPKLKDRVKRAGYKMRKAGENLAYTRQTKASSVAGIWRNSAKHWEAIVSRDFRDAGVAVAMGGDGKVYWVMNFGRQ